MSTRDFQSAPEDSLFAALIAELPQTTVPNKFGPSEGDALKSTLPATAQDVTFSFDPVSLDDARQTRQLNRSLRLGFMPPVDSTR